MTESMVPDLSVVASPPQQSLSYEDLDISEEPLGAGGQAVVYEATVIGSESPEKVALKEPHNEQTITTEAIESFLQEATTWQTIDRREREKPRWSEYEHIVGIVDTGENPFPWIAMEYMDGGNLENRLDNASDGLPVNEALWIGECLCRGLEIADEYGYSHLDVKPKNILFSQMPEETWDVPKLADWGVARTLAEQTGTMEAQTITYSAPEQFEPSEFGDPDSLTDLYQVGAVVYTLLTGKPPYTGSNRQIMRKVMGDVPTPPSQHRGELSKAIDVAVTKALAKEKTDRFRGFPDFEQALQAVRTDSPLPHVVANQIESTSTGGHPVLYKLNHSTGDTDRDPLTAKTNIPNPDRYSNLTGVVSDIQTGSGLIKRCSEEGCTHVLQNGRCPAHGEVDGEFDLRIKATIDDGKSPRDVIFDCEATEELTGIGIEEAKQMAKDALDTSVVGDKIRTDIFGKCYHVSGPIINDWLHANEFAQADHIDAPVELTGVLVDTQTGSGLIKRCSEEGCTHVLQNGRCSEHGEVDGGFDLQIKATIDDGKSPRDVIFDREATEELTGIGIEEAKQMAKDALDTSVVGDKIRTDILGKCYYVFGPVINQRLVVNEFTEIKQIDNSDSDSDEDSHGVFDSKSSAETDEDTNDSTDKNTSKNDTDADEPDMHQLSEEEREELESEYGADFSSGSEVDPAETAINDDTGGEDAAEGAESDAEGQADIHLEDAAVELMSNLDEGDGADREVVVAKLVDDYGVESGAVEDAINDALMSGRCYNPDDGTLKPI